MIQYKKMWEELKSQLQEDYNLGRIRKTTLVLIEVIEKKYSKETEEVSEPVVRKEPKKRGRRETK